MQTGTKVESRVRCFEPTARFDRMTRFGNMFVRPLLRSSAGKSIHELALLSFVGRRSGRHYEVPVEYHELDDASPCAPSWSRTRTRWPPSTRR
jgi:hypothetical protein